MKRNKYILTALSLYINYFIHGMGAIILAQNMQFLMKQLSTDKAGVAYVISALGIGRLIALYVSGVLSDKFGRKPFVFLGMAVYSVFFVGILFSKSVTVAFIFALFAGMANSILDAGTYPALMEAFPEAPGTANVMIKAFISAGQFLLPLIIGFLINNNLYYGYSFIFCIAVFLINAIFLIRLPFASMAKKEEKTDSSDEKSINNFKTSANFWIEGIALIIMGYTATATFYLISVWLPTYGTEVAKMSKSVSLALISYYSIGSLLSVFITSYLVKSLIRPVVFVLVYPFLSLLSLILLWLVPTQTVCILCAFLIGFTAAGGVLQLALTVMAELFPANKGRITGIVYTASSLATFTIPLITGIISKTSVRNIILLDVFIAAIGVLLGLIVNVRYKKVVSVESKAVNA